MVSKKAWATPKSVSVRGLIQHIRRASPPLSYAESLPRDFHIHVKVELQFRRLVKISFHPKTSKVKRRLNGGGVTFVVHFLFYILPKRHIIHV